jgi:stringent starvation protein B
MAGDLTSTRPYLLRALHEWISDNDETPLVVVDANAADVDVPPGHVKDGRIVLNIGWSATRNLQMDNDQISFSARFGGVSHAVNFPLAAVQGIYARESGQGMLFQDGSTEAAEASHAPAADAPQSTSLSNNDDNGPPSSRTPGLRLVK